MEITYIGYGAYHFHVPYLHRDTTLTANLSLNQQLEEVVINASLDKNQLQSPQIGKVTFNYSDIKRTPVLFGEADIVKVMQTQAGVSPGVAGFSDMYVRGGNKDENLYLIEGSPIYQVNHVAGLFSALNVEAIKGMDFYKAGFPARFGGRISSVVDVKLKDGNLNEYHGSATLGLTSGSLNLEGPIVKGKTAFNFNLRRSWFDVLTAPALAIWNATKSEGKSKTVARYAFTDLNFKLTHHFNTRSRAFAGVYWGKDYLKGGTKEEIEQTKEEDISRLNWGSVTAFGGWAYALSPKLYGTLNASYTHYRSDIRRDLKTKRKTSLLSTALLPQTELTTSVSVPTSATSLQQVITSGSADYILIISSVRITMKPVHRPAEASFLTTTKKSCMPTKPGFMPKTSGTSARGSS